MDFSVKHSMIISYSGEYEFINDMNNDNKTMCNVYQQQKNKETR